MMLRADDGRRVVDPSAEDVVAAIAALDGRQHTLLVLVGDRATLRITGGEPYLVVQFLAGDGEWLLVGDPDAEGEEQVVLAGERRSTLRRVLVGRRYAGAVAEHFRRKQKRRFGARWERVVIDA
ncbi:hypothetical protein D9V37_12255 [Nocardioides mangrovicus]|uniref:Uncharacterized protein n=1 Tax=Nocardioides mangrovicus TaxID=2478913 RepID=A0A3L8P2U4_9ACTN|nr:hypothetical protein [Nocardioides mangrovicus]RLV49307.1 hypothetical protein D9V37_12255 [Nocardioides mangrovicus]